MQEEGCVCVCVCVLKPSIKLPATLFVILDSDHEVSGRFMFHSTGSAFMYLQAGPCV